jgi:hypothetical protein
MNPLLNLPRVERFDIGPVFALPREPAAIEIASPFLPTDRGLRRGARLTVAPPCAIRLLAPHVGDRMAPLAAALGMPGGEPAPDEYRAMIDEIAG